MLEKRVIKSVTVERGVDPIYVFSHQWKEWYLAIIGYCIVMIVEYV